MNNKVRQTYFVCCAVIRNELICDSISAASQEQARSIFLETNGAAPKAIKGPFFIKKGPVLSAQTDLSFSGDYRQIVIDGWNIKAYILNKPRDTAWLLYEGTVDGRNVAKPQSKIVTVEWLQSIVGCTDE